MSYSDRNKMLARTYGSSLSSLRELGTAMQRGNYHVEGSEIVYANGKRMSLSEARSHMENVDNIGIIALNETNQAFRAMRNTEREAAKTMLKASQV